MTKIIYENPQEDNWFKWKGIKPPERIPHFTDEEREALAKANLAGHVCDWRQQGNFIFCDTGEFEHGKNVGTNQRLNADETKRTGTPVLDTIA